MTNLIEVKNNEIVLPEDLLKTMKELKRKAMEYDKLEKEMRAALLKAMQENFIKSFENDLLTVTIKNAHARTSVDSSRLKKEQPDIYEEYSKTTQVKESIQLSWK